MDTDQIEERLAKILGAPMEYLLQLGEEEEARQWRLLKVEGKFFKLLSEDSPDGGILYKARGTPGKSWTVHSVIISMWFHSFRFVEYIYTNIIYISFCATSSSPYHEVGMH